jgi:hypothetical protein
VRELKKKRGKEDDVGGGGVNGGKGRERKG